MFRDSYDWFLANRAVTTAEGASHHRVTAKQGVLKVAKRVLR
jgi:hypothetical protein